MDIKDICDHVRGLAGIDADDSELLNNMYLISTALLVQAYEMKGELSESEASKISILFGDLLKIALDAHKGDESAVMQLKAIEKLIHIPKMIASKKKKKKPFLPIIEDLISGYHTSPHLLRAWEVRKLMSRLSFFVSPVNEDATSIFDGPVKKRDDLELRDEELEKAITEAFEQASRIRKTPLTLQLLAIKIYLNQQSQEDKDCNLTDGDIRRDLCELEEWEAAHPDEKKSSYRLPILGGEDLPFQFASKADKK